MGFSVPLSKWFRGSLKAKVRNAVLSPIMADSGVFNMEILKNMVDEHQIGMRDHSACLWSLLVYESFLRQNF